MCLVWHLPNMLSFPPLSCRHWKWSRSGVLRRFHLDPFEPGVATGLVSIHSMSSMWTAKSMRLLTRKAWTRAAASLQSSFGQLRSLEVKPQLSCTSPSIQTVLQFEAHLVVRAITVVKEFFREVRAFAISTENVVNLQLHATSSINLVVVCRADGAKKSSMNVMFLNALATYLACVSPPTWRSMSQRGAPNLPHPCSARATKPSYTSNFLSLFSSFCLASWYRPQSCRHR